MDVIRHDHVAADEPCRGRTPSAQNRFMRYSGSQDLPSSSSARCDENQDRAIVCFERGQMDRVFAPDVLSSSEGRASARPRLLRRAHSKSGTCGSTSLRKRMIFAPHPTDGAA